MSDVDKEVAMNRFSVLMLLFAALFAGAGRIAMAGQEQCINACAQGFSPGTAEYAQCVRSCQSRGN